ncbi:hypothetical protein Mro02_58870 [Microbispora rosea subsp. aerata]|nr:hypothetical protein Mro02_58870 [Microbispora rosea subsp. aerata]GLJ85838.1 hypothetical protein GCM10017588_45710 [Microbispora rosea subsp. aerata]
MGEAVPVPGSTITTGTGSRAIGMLTTGTLTADRRTSTRADTHAIRTNTGTTVGDGSRTCAIGTVTTGTLTAGNRVGIPLAGIRTSTSAHASAGNPVGADATGTGSRAIGMLATNALALIAARHTTSGKAVPVAGGATGTGTGSRAAGRRAAGTDTPGRPAATGSCPVIGEGVIPGSAVPGSALGTGRAIAPGRATFVRTVAGVRIITCSRAITPTTTGEGVTAPGSARRSVRGSAPNPEATGSPAPAGTRDTEAGFHAGVGHAATTCAADECGRAGRRSFAAGARTTDRIVGPM